MFHTDLFIDLTENYISYFTTFCAEHINFNHNSFCILTESQGHVEQVFIEKKKHLRMACRLAMAAEATKKTKTKFQEFHKNKEMKWQQKYTGKQLNICRRK